MKKIVKIIILYPLLLLLLLEGVIAGHYYYNYFTHFKPEISKMKKRLRSEGHKPLPKQVENRVITLLEPAINRKATLLNDFPLIRINLALYNHFTTTRKVNINGGWITEKVARDIFRAKKLKWKSLHQKLLLAGLSGGVKSAFTRRQLLNYYQHETFFGGKNPGLIFSARHFFKKGVAQLSKKEFATLIAFQLYPQSVKKRGSYEKQIFGMAKRLK